MTESAPFPNPEIAARQSAVSDDFTSDNFAADLTVAQADAPPLPLTFDSSPAEQTLDRYFTTLNAGDFEGTAALFAEDGVLHPPFESGIVGRVAIGDHLNKEAQGLHVTPLRQTIESLESGKTRYKIIGTAQTALFSVNVGWNFILNDLAEICAVEVRLLAALKELLKLKR